MTPLALAVLLVAGQAGPAGQVEISPNPTRYQPVTLTLTGPRAGETDAVNPFRDFRFEVDLSHRGDKGSVEVTVPGYFAADGKAGETGATAGDKWRARFLPDRPGEWRYRVRFVVGTDAALSSPEEESEAPESGTEPLPSDGLEGAFAVAEGDEQAAGFYGTGPLTTVVPRERRHVCITTGTIAQPYLTQSYFPGPEANGYLKTHRDGRAFLKAGADSPENLLAYVDFDGTRALGGPQPKREGESSRAGLHRYEPHVRDWKEGDPTWQGGKGKGLIGALNYLASQGVNGIYFLPMNVEGDGKDVWPWVDEKTRDRFDVSKLDQWGVVFDHAASLGIALHVVLTETENENLFEALDGPGDGDVPFADTRKLYYRELVARFAHHPAVFWNLGEENGGDGKDGNELAKGNTTEQRKAFASYVKSIDPYGHPVVVHTYPGQYEKVYGPLAGFGEIDGPSLQMGDPKKAHAETLEWLRKSREAKRPWFVCVDEIGPADTGVVPDSDPSAPANHKLAREVLWGNLLAGGSGVEWYFGYKYPHNDLNCEDFRSREEVWRFTKAAVDFMHGHLPFDEMNPADEVVRADGAFCLAKPGEVYAVYLPTVRAAAEMKLPAGDYEIRWFDPVGGGELRSGTADRVEGGDRSALGEPPVKPDQDWVVLVRRMAPEN